MEERMKLRGRPKRSDIPFLIEQGKNSQSKVNKCEICKRTFPRRKNLNTHILTHFGDKKYECDFPNCQRSFTQSSQLKSHLFLHSTEKPFICPAEGCLERFAHSNRKCKEHNIKIIKQPETAEEIRKKFYDDTNKENKSENVKNWFEEYLSRKERGRKSPPASVQKIHDDSMEVIDSEEVSNGSEKVHDDLMEVTDSKEGSDSVEKIHDGLMEVIGKKEGNNIAEKVHDKNKGQEFQDGLLFYKFLTYLFKKGGNSKALFKKCIRSSPNAELSQILNYSPLI